jgi:pilus assembly protein Flp/PilA
MEERMKALIMRLIKKAEGEIAVEWAVLAGLIALAIVGGVTLLGGNLNTMYTNIAGWVGGIPMP